MDNMEQQHIQVDVRFSIVPEWLLDSSVSDKALRVYAILARYADNETMQAFPSRETIAERARCHVKTVDRALDELIAVKAITKKHRKTGNGFSSNIYTVKRVGTKMSLGRDTNVATVGTPVSPGRDTDVALTRTTELEPKELEPQKSAPRQNKETRLPEDWTPSERLMEMFETKWPRLEPDYEIEQFTNYWLSVNTRKADWDRTFQVWMNKNEKDADKRGLVRGKRLTNNEQAALLAMKYREQHAQAEITSETNPGRARQIETEATSWMKGIDDV